jgi:predicted nuclease of predicted toxin-antitoxin system
VITLDKDFGELVVVRRQPHAGILRLVGFRSAEQASAAMAARLNGTRQKSPEARS